MNAGDVAARDELIGHACERLRRLTRKMLQDFRRVKRWEDTDDVLHNALMRLLRALEVVPVGSGLAFFRLAAQQIRRELLDLSRHYYGPQGAGARQARPARPDDSDGTAAPAYEPPASTHEPSKLAGWTDFHRRVEQLPDGERAVFDLLWYQGLSQTEAAAMLQISKATVKRRWLAARLRLQDALNKDEEGKNRHA
jgi:RNA polymerase sigma-70 factor (ECF subfamily)